MRKILNKLVILLITVSAFIACQKTGSGIILVTNTDRLTQQPWKIRKYEQKINSGSYVDQFPGQPSCRQDDEYDFSASNTYQWTEGATKCSASDPQVIFVGFWEFFQNETILRMDNVIYTINKLNDDSLILFNTSILAPDTTYSRISLAH